MTLLSAVPHLFSAPPPPPRINDPIIPQTTSPPLPVPKRKSPPFPRIPPPQKAPSHSTPRPTQRPPPAFKSPHFRSRYYKPISHGDGVLAVEGERAVVVGESGVSYRLPGAPFEFQHSYSEVPKARPLAMREPAFLPFAPPEMPRPWTGKAPLLSKKEKERRRKTRLVDVVEEDEDEEMKGRVMEMKGRSVAGLYGSGSARRSREEVLGAPLSRAEVKALVKPHLSHNRQVNLGRDGLTHNMLELIHSHWRREQVCKVRCRGVPTVDMDNICYHLEEKTDGKIIHRIGGVVFLFRGRNYDPRTRPRYPVMLWKPAAPVYPKLIQESPEGVTKVEADELRRKGQNLPPICKLAKNGIYITLVKDVRDAFEGSQLVKINCEGMHASDYKKLGAKLKELVPCVLLSFDHEQILMWRGKDWKSRYHMPVPLVSNLHRTDTSDSDLKIPGKRNETTGECITRKEISSPKMLSLWKRAIESQKALLLNDTPDGPDSLLERVEEFESISQAAEHSYPALIVSAGEGSDHLKPGISDRKTGDNNNDEYDYGDTDVESYDEDLGDPLEDTEISAVPFGSLPVDRITRQLRQEECM